MPRRSILLFALVCLMPAHAMAQITLNPNSWRPNNAVFAIASTPERVYLGGRFTYIGPTTANNILFDLGSGQSTAQLRTNYYVSCCIADNDGGWYISGIFDTVGGVPRSGLAHILPNGSVDPNWNPSVYGGSVSVMALSGSTLYVGGSFWTINGVSCENLAALDTVSGGVIGSNYRANNNVYALAVSGSTLYVGGRFTSICGQSRNYLAAVDVNTGNALGWNPNPSTNGYVYNLAVAGSTIYVHGAFTTIGGASRNLMAALDTGTALATSWNPAPNNTVSRMVLAGSTIYVVGDFTSIGRQSRNKFAAVDMTVGDATALNPALDFTPLAVAATGSKLYVGGKYYTPKNETRGRIVELDAATGNPTGWAHRFNDFLRCVTVSGTKLWVGGPYYMMDGQERNYLAALDAATGQLTDWNPDPNDWVYALQLSGSTIFAAGKFTTIGGQNRNQIAAINTTSGAATGWDPNASYSYGAAEVRSLALSGTTLFASGTFTNIGGAERNSITGLDVNTGLATQFNPAPSPYARTIYPLALSGSTLYTSGYFTTIGGLPRNYSAALDITTGTALAWNANAVESNRKVIDALAISGSRVYAGGYFSQIGGASRNHIAALNAYTGADLGWNPNADAVVHAILPAGPTVFVGGEFTSIGSTARSYLAAVNATTGTVGAWNPTFNGTVFALNSCGSKLYVGGEGLCFAEYDNAIQRTLTYLADSHGGISGSATQYVLHGSNGTPVTAVPGTGYFFLRWSDGATANPRTEINVTSDLTVTAIFAAKSSPVWVKFDFTGTEDGTQTNPFNTMSEGIAAVTNSGVVRIFHGSTPTPVRIIKPLRLESTGGIATVGK